MLHDAGSSNAAQPACLEELYAELRRLAIGHARHERSHPVQPTSLVHAAWLRWSAGSHERPESRAAFLAGMSRVMRRVLVDQARARAALKRGGGLVADRTLQPIERGRPTIDLLALDEALERLDRLRPRQRKVVEMMFFAGMTQLEVAAVLDLSERTVRDEWTAAQSWLREEMHS